MRDRRREQQPLGRTQVLPEVRPLLRKNGFENGLCIDTLRRLPYVKKKPSREQQYLRQAMTCKPHALTMRGEQQRM